MDNISKWISWFSIIMNFTYFFLLVWLLIYMYNNLLYKHLLHKWMNLVLAKKDKKYEKKTLQFRDGKLGREVQK